ncbi:MAG: ABC transporter permease [Roseburia sp.]
MNRIGKKMYFLALLPFLILVGLFEIFPILSLILQSFIPENETIGFTLQHYVSVFSKPLYRTAIMNSLMVSLVSTVVGLVVAFVGGQALHNLGGKGRLKAAFLSLLNMVSDFSGVPLAFSFIILFGHSGVFTAIGTKFGIGFLAEFPLYSIWGLLSTYIYFQIPLAILLTIPAFDGIKREWKESVNLMGGSNLVFWLKVGIPVMLPSLLGTFSVLFANAVSAYGTAYALLSNNASILPIRISEQFVGDIVQQPHFGSSLAAVMMAMLILSIVINDKIQKTVKGGKQYET